MNIVRSWRSGNERADNTYFWSAFKFNKNEVLIENTDGIIKGCLFEFKNSILDLNIVLGQAIRYLSKIRNKGGIPVPSKVVLIDISKNKAFVYDATQYRSEIECNYTQSASKLTRDLIIENATKPEKEFIFDIDTIESPDNFWIKSYFNIDKYQKFDINFPNILGWANFIYSQNRRTTKTEMFSMLKNPENTIIQDYINPWQGKEEDFALVLDALNDPINKKDLGAFYTPLPYVKYATELVRKAISAVPNDKDYVILDRCAGTGALESCLSQEELSHVIINTFEIKEWLVLYNKYSTLVRAIIPPLEVVRSNKENLVIGGDALSEGFLTVSMETNGIHKNLQQVIDDPNVVIIGLENPPYSNELARMQEGNKKPKDDYGFIRQKMSAEFSGDSSHAKDLVNQFIWSFETYFMRNEYDSYVLFAPVKYWKSVGLMKKKFIDGCLTNRGNFKAQESSILLALWQNISDEQTNEITVTAKEIWSGNRKWGTGSSSAVIDIPKEATLKNVQQIKVRKVNATLGKLYAKREDGDRSSSIVTGFDGKETSFKPYTRPYHNDNILAIIEASGFGMTSQDIRMTRLALYHNRGSIVRTHNYHTQVVLFVAKHYPLNNWYEKELLFTTSDRGKEYEKDIDFLRKSILWTCISHKNHCLSFIGSDGVYYKNELCFDENTLIRNEVVNQEKFGKLDKADIMLLGVFEELLDLAKQTREYKSEFSYGTYQIELEINISYKDSNNKKVFKNEKVNTKLRELKTRLKEYYESQLKESVLKYELVK